MSPETAAELLKDIRSVATVGDLKKILEKYFQEDAQLPTGKKNQLNSFGLMFFSGLPEKE